MTRLSVSLVERKFVMRLRILSDIDNLQYALLLSVKQAVEQRVFYSSRFYSFRQETTQTCFRVFKNEGDIAQINNSHELASFGKEGTPSPEELGCKYLN